MRTLVFLAAASGLLLSTAAGCGDDGAGGADAGDLQCPTEGRYFPLATGASWTFRTTDVSDGTIAVKTQTVGPLEDVGGDKAGTTAYRLTTTKPSGGMVVSWQEDLGDAIVRHREQDMAGSTQSDETFVPYKVRVDETPAHTMLDATWVETFDTISVPLEGGDPVTTPKTETWTVEGVDEEVTVPAGRFCALRVRKVSMTAQGGSDKTYWFVRGIGKVREDGANQLEQLTEYSLP